MTANKICDFVIVSSWKHDTIAENHYIHAQQDQTRIAHQISTFVHKGQSPWVIINEMPESSEAVTHPLVALFSTTWFSGSLSTRS